MAMRRKSRRREGVYSLLILCLEITYMFFYYSPQWRRRREEAREEGEPGSLLLLLGSEGLQRDTRMLCCMCYVVTCANRNVCSAFALDTEKCAGEK
jgi:hypothetical protein